MQDEDGMQRCPSCDSTNVKGVMVTDKFPYGVGANPVELTAEVLMFTCYDCRLQYTGEQAEEARTGALNEFLQKPE